MEEPITPEILEEIKEEQLMDQEEADEDKMILTQEQMEAYGYPEPEEKQSQHSFLHKAAFGTEDTIRTTYLSESELGRPLFNIRFLLDMEDIADHYLKGVVEFINKAKSEEQQEEGEKPKEELKPIKVENKISRYFKMKAYNISDSGMSNQGFSMNLNVMRKLDMTRKRSIENLKNLQGGKQRKK